MLSALDAGDEEQFVRLRAHALSDELDEMTQRLAAPGENDRPTIAYLVGGAA
jgi:hypothetical protein